MVDGTLAAVLVRPLGSDETGLQEALGAITVAAYVQLEPDIVEHGYDAELRDVAGRVAAAEVLVALDGNEVLGGVTYVPDAGSAMAEFTDPHAAGVRMLAVSEPARRRGVGEALTVACIDRARAGGRHRVILHSTPAMVAAHRIYKRLGFERDPGLDWEPEPGVHLLGFVLPLS